MAFQKLWATLLIAVATITAAIATQESKEVYIIPSDSNGLTCPTTNTEQCFTLQELYETQLQGTFKITSNTTLNFLTGEHIIGPQVYTTRTFYYQRHRKYHCSGYSGSDYQVHTSFRPCICKCLKFKHI